ncbi:hypothetical protein V501_07174 [Pseudogymnoascus sp. VKM F-4519 (FW-2642)]|nr:hypothetical protein V501_07174 [Pseudogymnoascus sp. VKM F-4519 (FW-2642)]
MAEPGLNSLSCILCGALIPENNEGFQPWMRSFRAIYTVNDAYDTARVSAVGIRCQIFDPLADLCRAPLWWPRDDPSLEGGHVAGHDGAITRALHLNSPPRGFRGTGEIFWGFPVHSACWDLLTTLRPWSLLDTQAIFDICRSVPPRDGVLLFGHDYGGICEPDSMFATYPGEKPQRMLHRKEPPSSEPVINVTHENPLRVPGLREIFERGSADHCFTNFLIVGESTESDPFSALPSEILELIAAELTLEDISQLKEASRVYANLVLSDIFWHSRFRRGGEFEHVFESMEYGSQCKGRWRSICLRAKELELQSHPAMLNRKRIVKLAWELLDLVDRQGKLSCSMLDSPPSLLGHLESSAPIDPLKWVTASRSLLPRNEHFDHGTRCLYKLTVDVPSDIASVFISTINVFGLLYISGIRFEQKSGASTEVGYIHLKSEALVIWADSRPACIIGFQLAQDPRGIRGIAIESATGGLSNWVGEYDGIPRRRLIPHRSKRDGSNRVALLQGGFDALKLVTLSVADKGDTETDVHSSRDDEAPAPRDANIWYPEIPDSSLSFIGAPGFPGAYRNRQDEMPLSTILFGGLKGELLCHIVKMTVWIADIPPAHYVVCGIGFTFDCPVEGKNSLVLGYSRDDGENYFAYDFPIDGRGGERICGMDKIFQYNWASDLRFRWDFAQECALVQSEQITPNDTGLVYIKDPVDEPSLVDECRNPRKKVKVKE